MSTQFMAPERRELRRASRPPSPAKIRSVRPPHAPRELLSRGMPLSRSLLESLNSPARPTSNGGPPPVQAPPVQAPPVQAPPVQAPPVQAPAVPCTITTATVAAAPSGAANTRRTVGVNEQVTMTASASAAWTASGGTLSAVNGPVVTWTAPAAAATPTITATPASGAPCNVSMTVIKPSGAPLTRTIDRVYSPTLSGSGFRTDLFLTPFTVSFSRVETREEVATSVANGYYDSVLGWNNIVHPQTAGWIGTDARNYGGFDDVGTEAPGNPGRFSAGSFTWAIPQSYRVVGASGNGANFATNFHVQVMTGPTGEEKTSKGGASRTRTPAAPPPPRAPAPAPPAPAPAPTPTPPPPAPTPTPSPTPGGSGRSAPGPGSKLAGPASNGPPPPVQAPPVQGPPVQAPPVQGPPVQAPPVQAPPVQAPPVPCTITTATVAAAPSGAANTRKTVGVNEQVTMTASASAAWTASGGTLSAVNGTVVTWTAPAAATTPTITATPASGAPCNVTMTVIPPSGAPLTKGPDRVYSAHLSGSGFRAELFLAPLTVCFSRVEVREEAVMSVATGYYNSVAIPWNNIPHPQTAFWTTVAANNRVTFDDIGSPLPGMPGPFSAGSFTWPIPQSYRIVGGSGNGNVCATNTHSQVMTGPSGEETTSKAGATRTRTPTP